MKENSGLHLYDWLKAIKTIVPPLCVEVFLTDGTSYFLNSVCYWDDEDPVALIRVWDFREMSDKKDIDELKRAMDKVKERREYGKPENIHQKLDWANLRIPKNYIAYVVEWHDRLWQRGELGFKSMN